MSAMRFAVRFYMFRFCDQPKRGIIAAEPREGSRVASIVN